MTSAGQQTAARIPAIKKPRRSFMKPGELVLLRRTVIKVSQARLVEQLVSPENGLPIAACTLSLYESGARPVPLWAARRIRELAQAARSYDSRHPVV